MSEVLQETERDDYRYPITVWLMREDRPKYWTFHCPYCTAKLCELDGNMVQIRDVSHDTSVNRASVRIKCPGTNRHGQGYCRLWFEFVLHG